MTTVLVGAFAVGWISVQGQSRLTLTGQDYAEIEQLLARYYQGLDFEDMEMLGSIFTEDATYTLVNRELVGREAIVGSVEQRISTRPPEHERRHWQNNAVITPTAEGATGRTYWISFEVSYVPPKPALSGHWDDIYVRTPGGWRIKDRKLTINQPLRDSFGYVW
jgi:hypothetical protein